jgi:hypothetical protein
MKIYLMLEIDETDSRGWEIVEELELAADEDEGIRVRTAGTGFTAKVLTIEEVR